MKGLKDLARAVVPPSMWRTLQRSKRIWIARNYKERQLKQNFNGFELTLHITDPLAQHWYGQGNPTLAEVTALRSGQLRQGARVFDLGAHQGVVAMVLAKIVGEHGSVIAVEANPYNAAVAIRNAASNYLPQLTVIPGAIAEASGTLRFGNDWGEQSPDAKGTEVEVLTLDQITDRFGPPDVIFIDIEGFELKALLGGPRTLSTQPDLLIEVHLGGELAKHGGSLEKILRLLPDDRFELFGLDPLAEHTPTGMVPVPLAKASFVDHRFFLLARAKK